MKSQKWIQLILLLLVIGISGCSLSSKDVETVVTEENMRYWKLSPDGNGLVYGGARNEDNYLAELPIRKKQNIDCLLSWLNDEMLLCYRERQTTILDRDTFIESDPFKEVDIKTLSSTVLNDLLANAEEIFRPVGNGGNSGYIYIYDTGNENYAITNVEDLDGTLRGYTYTSFPTRFGCPQDALGENSISPDGLYYYTVIRQSQSILTIAKVADNEMLATFTTEEAKAIVCGGWAGDSSGVYFQVHGTGLNIAWSSPEIQKLKVPAK